MKRISLKVQPNAKMASMKPRKKPFRELFSAEEIGYYGVAIMVFIVLGVLFNSKVLNLVVGPSFFVAWIWIVPPLWEKWRNGRTGQ